MPLKTQLEAITDSLQQNLTFIYGKSREANVKADGVEPDSGIVFVYPDQPITSTLQVNSTVHDEYSLFLMFLFINDFDNDTEQCEPLVIAANRLKNLFLQRLSMYRTSPLAPKFFKIPKGAKFISNPVYNKFDANTCGVTLQLRVQIRQDEYLLNC